MNLVLNNFFTLKKLNCSTNFIEIYKDFNFKQ